MAGPRPYSGPQIMLSPEHCVPRVGGRGRSFFLEGQGLPSPRIPDPPVSPHFSDYQCGLEAPPTHTWTLGPCSPVGLWLQTLHHAQGQLGAWHPEATDPDTVPVITVSLLPSAGPLLRPLSTMVVPLSPASPITFVDPTFQSQLLLLLNSKGTGTGPPRGEQVAWKCQSRKEGV